MSRMKPENRAFYDALHARGMSLKLLASCIQNKGTSHLIMTLNNTPGRGSWTRKKLAAWLTDEELAMKGWDRYGRIVTPRSTGNKIETI